MPRYVIGATFTPEERASMNLPPHGSGSQPIGRVASHHITVSLPDGSSCPVIYRRFGAYSHRFLFGDPLHEAVWFPEALHNTPPTIEQKAEELVPKAFAQAMAEEQQMMRHKTVPKGSTVPPGEPQLRAKTAETVAGCYAVCLRASSGRLSPIGRASATAEQPIAELHGDTHAYVQLFGEQRLVIGICCRYLRRWGEPRLLPFQRDVPILAEIEEEDAEIE